MFKTYQMGYKVSWSADLANGSNERIQWRGDLEDETMSGKRVHIDSDGNATERFWTAEKVIP